MPSIDVDATREKYRQERDKRIRPRGAEQFNYAEGALDRFDDDPYAGEPAPRDPFVSELEVLVIGAGFGGMQAAAELTKAGITDFRILDVAADFGGTWYWNRYPGVRCDVESYVYLPLLEETGYVPTERYAGGAEIFAYCKQLARHFGLYEHALFQTHVEGMVWDEGATRWTVTTDRGDRIRARFVITQSGIFSRPQLPGIDGIADFEGTVFHSSRWDFGYTGGDTNGDLDKLHDKRVAVVGTGASGLQIIPHLARAAQHLTVFQRTPTQVNVRDNGPTDVDWFTSQEPGWQRRRMDNFNAVTQGGAYESSLVDDGWTRSALYVAKAVGELPEAERTPERIAEAAERADFEWGELNRERVDSIVTDPATAAVLKAYYRQSCKRPGFSDDFLPAFNRPNVELVDTAANGIDRITAHGIVADGVEREFDLIVFATGFELGSSWVHQAGYDIVGEGGRLLSDKWQSGIRTFHGLFSNGFPNLFFFGLTQTGATVSVPHMLQEQVEHIVWVIRECERRGIASVQATPEAEEEWLGVIRAKNAARRQMQIDCTPGYFNNEGMPERETGAINAGLFYPSQDFFDMLEEWRQAEMPGLIITS
jgi:cyclohexanone monooxygenase